MEIFRPYFFVNMSRTIGTLDSMKLVASNAYLSARCFVRYHQHRLMNSGVVEFEGCAGGMGILQTGEDLGAAVQLARASQDSLKRFSSKRDG